MKKKPWFIIVLLIVIAVFGLWHHFSKKPVPLNTLPVIRGDISVQAEAIGSIVPLHSVTVKSQLSGIVQTIYHQAGDIVKTGDRLTEIKPMPTPQEMAAALDAVKEDQINVLTAQKKLNNYEYLLKTGFIKPTFIDYLQSKQEFETFSSKLKLDQQNLDLLQSGNAVINGKPMQSVITSPIDGYILQRNVDVGDPVIAMGQAQEPTALFSIANMQDLYFKGTVDESDTGKIKIGLPAIITVGALPNARITGVVSQLALQSTTQNAVENANKGLQPTDNTPSPFNNGFEIEINQLQVPTGVKLRSGYSATANIMVQTKKDVLLIPEMALLFEGDKTFVNVLAPDGKSILKTPVTVGLSDGIQAEIVKGLQGGEKILPPA